MIPESTDLSELPLKTKSYPGLKSFLLVSYSNYPIFLTFFVILSSGLSAEMGLFVIKIYECCENERKKGLSKSLNLFIR